MEHFQPYIDGIVTALVGLLVTFTLGVVAMLRVKVTAWIDTRTTAQQREILHRLASEGMALAESTWGRYEGNKKLDDALMYVLNRTGDYGIYVGMDTIKAAVEKAVLDYNAKVKQTKEGVVAG